MVLKVMKFANRIQLVEFVNRNCIQKENIQLIADNDNHPVLYYWCWEE